ncbi:MAG: hypothetical protein M3O41_20505 [Pseudomonadota bacterium]|nr:hypothetical protein [Pseudomonadota bacterium]
MMVCADITRAAATALCILFTSGAASGQATSGTLAIRTVAEVETVVRQDGHEFVKLAAAERVVPGDQVIYTLEIRNIGAAAVREPTVTNPIPPHMVYVAESATGPGVETSYSVDGGHSFDKPENLRIPLADGQSRQAIDKDYTHIRWKLKHPLKANSVAYARFRAVVK